MTLLHGVLDTVRLLMLKLSLDQLQESRLVPFDRDQVVIATGKDALDRFF